MNGLIEDTKQEESRKSRNNKCNLVLISHFKIETRITVKKERIKISQNIM